MRVALSRLTAGIKLLSQPEHWVEDIKIYNLLSTGLQFELHGLLEKTKKEIWKVTPSQKDHPDQFFGPSKLVLQSPFLI